MVVSEIRLYELLKAKIGEKEAEAFVEILDKRVDEKFEAAKNTLATKADIAELKIEIAQIRTELASQKAEIIKWMFLFWVGQVAVMFGIVAFLMRH